MKYVFFLLFLAGTAAFAQGPLSYPQEAFDSDTCCWRRFSREKKHREAAMLIVQYLEYHPSIRNRHALHWHAGQLYAMAGDGKQARKYFKKTYSLFYRWFGGEDGKAWYYYARGNVAFVNRDKRTLERMLRLWQKKIPPDKNYRKLQGMLDRWHLGYEEANTD